MIFRVLMLLFFGLTLGLLLIDCVFSNDTTLRYLGINSTLVFILFLITNIILAFFDKFLFPKKLVEFNRDWLTIPLAVIAAGFVVINYLTYQTFILSYLGIQVENFILLVILSGSLTYISHSKSLNLKQQLVYFLGPLVLIALIFLDYYSNRTLRNLSSEDGFFETLQFLFYLSSGLISLFLVFRFYKKKEFINLLIFLILGIILVGVALEEISWGQRIFNIETPAKIAESNWQGELNVHNQGFIQKNIHFFYMGLGLFCSLAGALLLKYYEKIKEKHHILIPSTLTFFYFFSIFVYYFLNEYMAFYYEIFSAKRTEMGRWQESAELFLALGFLIFLMSAFKKVQRQATFLNKPSLEENPLIP